MDMFAEIFGRGSRGILKPQRRTAEYLSEHIHSLNNGEAVKLWEKVRFADYQDKTEVVWDLSALLGYVTDMELRFYLHGITLDEYEIFVYFSASSSLGKCPLSSKTDCVTSCALFMIYSI